MLPAEGDIVNVEITEGTRVRFDWTDLLTCLSLVLSLRLGVSALNRTLPERNAD